MNKRARTIYKSGCFHRSRPRLKFRHDRRRIGRRVNEIVLLPWPMTTMADGRLRTLVFGLCKICFYGILLSFVFYQFNPMHFNNWVEQLTTTCTYNSLKLTKIFCFNDTEERVKLWDNELWRPIVFFLSVARLIFIYISVEILLQFSAQIFFISEICSS